MGELSATLPGAHRSLKYVLPAGLAYVASWKMRRNARTFNVVGRKGVGWMRKIVSSKKKMYPTPVKSVAGGATRRSARLAGRSPARGRAASDVSMRSVRGRKRKNNAAPRGRYVRRRRIRRRYKKSGVYNSMKSGGFFQVGSKKKTTMDMCAQNGIVFVGERGFKLIGGSTGGVNSDRVQTAFVAHCTFTPTLVKEMLARALCRLVAKIIKVEASFDNWDSAVHLNANASYRIVIVYKRAVNDNNQTVIINVLGGTTYFALYQQFYTMFSGFDNVVGRSLDLTTMRIYEVTGVAPNEVQITKGEYDLSQASVYVNVKSTLKVQNSTRSTEGDEADDVDNIPLHGKIYVAKGNYLGLGGYQNNDRIFAPPRLQQLPYFTVAGSNIIPPGSEFDYADRSWKEPPLKSQVKNCSSATTIHLEPGQIKTSVITYSQKHNLNTLVRECLTYALDVTGFPAPNDGIITGPVTKLGKTHMIGLEKMIQSETTTENNKIRLSVELDHKYGCIINTKRAKAVQWGIGTYTE